MLRVGRHTWRAQVGGECIGARVCGSTTEAEALHEIHDRLGKVTPVVESLGIRPFRSSEKCWHLTRWIGAPTRDSGTLADILTSSSAADVEAVVARLLTSWRRRLGAFQQKRSMTDRINELFGERVRAGCRAEVFCSGFLALAGQDYREMMIKVNGRSIRFDPSRTITFLQRSFASGNTFLSTLGNGDATDTNLCVDRLGNIFWVDLERGGWCPIEAELATLIVHLAAQGGWLTPIADPARYREKPAIIEGIVMNTPRLSYEIGVGCIEVQTAVQWTPGRTVAVRMLRQFASEMARDLGVPDPFNWLLPFLIARVISVVPPWGPTATADIAVWHLATIALLTDGCDPWDIQPDTTQ